MIEKNQCAPLNYIEQGSKVFTFLYTAPYLLGLLRRHPTWVIFVCKHT